MLILDFSGSVRGQNLADMQAAVISMLDAYNNAGYAVVQLVTFSGNANIPADGGWISVADAKAYINGLTDADMGGSTNYDAALAAAQSAFAEAAGKIPGAKNIAYFLSDGSPTSGNGSIGIDPAEQAAWENFLTNNAIDSHAVGFGGASTTELEPIAYNGIDGTECPALDATTAGANLTQVLLDTVAQTVPGNLFGSLATGGFGADGAGIVTSLTVGGVTYAYDSNNDTITGGSSTLNGHQLTVTTSQGGILSVNMLTGEYTYLADPTFTISYNEIVAYALQDADGDATSGTLTLNVARDVKPVPTLLDNTADVYEAAMSTGTNPDSTAEVATGNILSDDTIPAGLSLSNVSIAGGATVINGNTITVTTAEGNTLVVDKITGDYTYTLNNPVKHLLFSATGNQVTLANDTFTGGVLDGWTGTNVSNKNDWLRIDGRGDVATKTFDFGQSYANQTVHVTFDFKANDKWDANTSDSFRMAVNGVEISNVPYGKNATDTYSFDVTLDASGKAYFELTASTNSNKEDAFVDNFKITGPQLVPTPTDVLVDSFTYTVTDLGGTAYNSKLNVSIHDDAPIATTQNQQINVPQQDTNLMVILDLSGSMQGSRLAAARTAISNLIDTYNGYGDVAVKLVTFSTLAQEKTSYWMTASEAKAILATLSASGWTNYDTALAQAIQSWDDGSRITTPPSGGVIQNVAYFISDGQPNMNDGDTTVLANSNAGGTSGADAGIQAAEEST
ncbi:hypothetical protein EBS_0820 [endosymbiont of unidentified scaly snail isolate Monju]|nr:hypothetical protein EBS_0820 [endosymbiont of unidentified scaly snail isolate Monju]